MKAMILAAGLASRMRPITNKLPKPLIDVGGISLIERLINQLIAFGVSEFVINVSYLGDQIKEALKSTDAISKIIFVSFFKFPSLSLNIFMTKIITIFFDNSLTEL